MTKRDEKFEKDSCFNKAREEEMLFVLRAHDIVAPEVIRFWAQERIRFGKNTIHDVQIQDALQCALTMEKQQKKGM